MDSSIQRLKNATFKGHLVARYAVGIILYQNQMTCYFGMTMLNMVANEKVDNVSKLI